MVRGVLYKGMCSRHWSSLVLNMSAIVYELTSGLLSAASGVIYSVRKFTPNPEQTNHTWPPTSHSKLKHCRKFHELPSGEIQNYNATSPTYISKMEEGEE
eukprot:gb/GECG01010406.1/.p1 GENE.gb/GECG01010406.1/~~gb/GECG01010406.1/.p1  ORF type:complete len:100 (+),score=7.59 gb/GECG01010406.1/:1-300(+)